MKFGQKLNPHRSDPCLASHPSHAPISSTTRTCSRAKLTADRNAPKPKEKRPPSPRPECGSISHKQKPVGRGIGDSATVSVKRGGGSDNDDSQFLEAVSIGESLERGLDAFLPLLESVPPLFRSHGYHRRKNEFLNVKGILSTTVRTLKATRRGDVRNIVQQYVLFKHMIYDNLRSLLFWLDSEMERHKETQQKRIDDLPSQTPRHVRAPCSPRPQPQPQPPSHPTRQSTEMTDSPVIKELSGPKAQSDKRRSVFSEVASSLTPILNSPLDVEMPPPVGDAANFVIVDGVVKYANLEALVFILTNPKPNPDIRHLDQLHDAFLLCFRCFSTSVNVVSALTARFRQPQPENLSKEQEIAWPFHLQAIRLRVIDVLHAWVDSYWVHEDDRQAASLIQHFIESTTELRWSETRKSIAETLRRRFLISGYPDMSRDARHLRATNSFAIRARSAEHLRSSVRLLDTYAVKALNISSQDALNSATSVDDLVGNEDVAHVLNFSSEQHCTELARQLTIFMSDEFRKMDPEKLWHHMRRQCQDCHTEQAIKILQLHALALEVWTARSVVEQDDPEKRTGVLTFFVALAIRFRKLRNFSALCSVYRGLTSGFMDKLSHESLPIPEATKSVLQDLFQLVKEARSDHKLAAGCRNPAIPPIEWFLDNFRSVIEGQRHVSVPPMPRNAVNIENYCKVSQIVRGMENCHIPYASLVRATRVQAWISKSLFGVSEQDLDEGRAWVESRCDAIERRSPKPKLFAQCVPFPLIGKETAAGFTRTPAEITQLVPELLPSTLESHVS